MPRFVLHLAIALILTVMTQIGGVAWVIGLFFRRRIAAFVCAYALLWVAAILIAPLGNRVPLHCWQTGPVQVQAWVYCATNRNYLDPELLLALEDTAEKLREDFSEAKVQVLDANFPFFDGFPLLPHLSHDDGEKVDLAFLYKQDGRPAGTRTPSPVGYFAFEQGETDCPRVWPTLRWDLPWLQPLWRDMELDNRRTKLLVELLVSDHRIGKLFLEPHLVTKLQLKSQKIRFQGCRAARHDDHIHLQL